MEEKVMSPTTETMLELVKWLISLNIPKWILSLKWFNFLLIGSLGLNVIFVARLIKNYQQEQEDIKRFDEIFK
jgi:hypothetical protein